MDMNKLMQFLDKLEQALWEKSRADGNDPFWNKGGKGYEIFKETREIREKLSKK